MLKKISLIFSFFTLFFLISNTTKASFIDNKLYVGGGLGIPTNDLKIWNNQTYDNQISKDRFYYKTNPIINIFLGYDVIKFFAIEGEFNYALPKTVNNPRKYKDTTTSYISAFINLIGKYQTKYGTPFIKLGFGYTNIDAKNTFNDPDYPNEPINYWENDGFIYKLGAGYDYNITQHHIVGLEYNYEHNINDIQITRISSGNSVDFTYEKSFLINQYIKLTYKYKF